MATFLRRHTGQSPQGLGNAPRGRFRQKLGTLAPLCIAPTTGSADRARRASSTDSRPPHPANRPHPRSVEEVHSLPDYGQPRKRDILRSAGTSGPESGSSILVTHRHLTAPLPAVSLAPLQPWEPARLPIAAHRARTSLGRHLVPPHGVRVRAWVRGCSRLPIPGLREGVPIYASASSASQPAPPLDDCLRRDRRDPLRRLPSIPFQRPTTPVPARRATTYSAPLRC